MKNVCFIIALTLLVSVSVFAQGQENKEVLDLKNKIIDIQNKGKSPVFDLFATNDLDLGELPAGNYVFKAVVKDKLSGQTATGKFKFVIE